MEALCEVAEVLDVAEVMLTFGVRRSARLRALTLSSADHTRRRERRSS